MPFKNVIKKSLNSDQFRLAYQTILFDLFVQATAKATHEIMFYMN